VRVHEAGVGKSSNEEVDRLSVSASGHELLSARLSPPPKADLLHDFTQQRGWVSPASCYAWFLIRLRISVMCFGYPPLKYSKVSGLAV
jgi:hypothetical protein